ncbi:MAG: hypothetical protein IJ608_01290 [Lachnospiraceae bacterium]|nr:hypothetical protein [Lachnospiraceae bacterium]
MRLSRAQMKAQYPNHWLGLTDIKWKNDDGVTLESAEVSYTDLPSDELLLKQIETDGAVIAWYTNDRTMQLGMAEVM